MESNFNQIRKLQTELKAAFERIEKSSQTKNVERAIALGKIIKFFKEKESQAINNLFNAGLEISNDDVIKQLKSLQDLLKVILLLEQNIKENMKKSELLSIIKECVKEVLITEAESEDRLKSIQIKIDNKKKTLSDPTLKPERKSELQQSLNKLIIQQSELKKKSSKPKDK